MNKYLMLLIVSVFLMSFANYSDATVISQTYSKTEDAEIVEQIPENIEENKDLLEITDLNEIDNNKETLISQEELEKQQFEERVKKISELVQPSIVYGTMKKDDGVFKKGEQVEIIRDKGNGKTYYVSSNDKKGWINGSSISIPEDFKTLKTHMEKEDMEFFVNQMNDFNSKTKYFIWIDLSRQLVNIFEDEKGNWQLIHSFLCATGKNETPTVRGTFEVNGRGLRFGNAVGAKNWVRFYESYLLHSITIDAKGNILDTTLGKRASHGCVRMSMKNSKWVYDNIPDGTTVWVN